MSGTGPASTAGHVALRHWDEFRLHVRAALNNGLTKDEIKELLIQASVYAGVPSANHAFREASAVFAEGK
jgi:4-carboxymuconolactone decarboxylase